MFSMFSPRDMTLAMETRSSEGQDDDDFHVLSTCDLRLGTLPKGESIPLL